MALLSPQQSKITGTTLTFAAAAAGGDTLSPGARGALHVRNDDVASTDVTVVIPGNTQFAQPQPDVVVSVAAGDQAAIGPFPRTAADTDGLVDITYSSVTSLFVAYVTV